jgi:hypothetical protein
MALTKADRELVRELLSNQDIRWFWRFDGVGYTVEFTIVGATDCEAEAENLERDGFQEAPTLLEALYEVAVRL